ncbi:histone-lysine N-methyltransferase, H3 lysine-79 specific-like isoform X1 [Pseudorasbora parva]|uniref:histone-lysine N-methyltransferase, H3 lysine-79 specific-like isoform X1 n=1 Tax=Pseudorasbora parva TaxID=51549 RepID=UPI00351E3391
MVLKFTSCDVIIVQVVNHQNTDIVQMPGATLRQCPHCRIKMNCRHRSCVKCGKLLDFKYKQSVRLAKFRDQAHQWAKTTVKSRNQSKVLDNLAIMMEKLKALGYVPLLLLGKCSKAHKWTAEVQCPFEFPHEGHQVMEKMLILFEHILKGFGPEKEQEVTEGNEAERQDLNKTVEDEEDITLENNVEVEQQIESGEEEPERPVEEQSFKSPEKDQEETEGNRTESQDINEALEDEEDILSENNVEVRMKERLDDEEQIEEQLPESGGGELERPEEGEIKVTKKTKQAKTKKKEAKKQKISALKMDEMDERKETEGVVLKPDCKSAVNMAAKRKRQTTTDTDCPFHASLDVFPVEFVSKTRLRKGRKEVLVHWLPCPSCRKTWPPTWQPEDHVEITLAQC